jgi:hypothetical protein
MTNRAKWMASLVEEAFGVRQYEASDPFTKSPSVEVYQAWASGTGPPQLFIYHQRSYKFNDQGEIEDLYRN